MKIQKAHKTNAIIVKIPENSPKEIIGSIEMMFSNQRRCGASSFEMLIRRDPYVIIVYSSEVFQTVQKKVFETPYKIEEHTLMVKLKPFMFILLFQASLSDHNE